MEPKNNCADTTPTQGSVTNTSTVWRKKKKKKKSKSLKKLEKPMATASYTTQTRRNSYSHRGPSRFAPRLAPEKQLFKLAEQTSPVKIDLENAKQIDFRTVALEVWEKKRCLKCPMDSKMLAPRNLFKRELWVAPTLQALKKKLNDTKDLLNEIPLDEWHQHTNRMNTAGKVMSIIRTEIRPEYCSQAWCKIFECLSSFPVIPRHITDVPNQPDDCIPFLSVHLCEAPGAFISATNHFIHTNYSHIKWAWVATTLNPHYEGNDVGNMINEDKLILSSMENWLFLEDTTGNIMNQANVNSLCREVEKRCKNHGCNVGLVTADGSIDCQRNPSEQEATVTELQFTEIVVALNVLGKGGSFILKIFTFLECQTINHLYLLCSLFTEVHLFKPATSKEGNSEVYVICLGYLGVEAFQWQLRLLRHQIGLKNSLIKKKSMIPSTLVIRHPFIWRLVEAASFFTGYQMAIIKRNLKTFDDPESLNLTYLQNDMIRDCVASEWLSRYQLKKLPPQYSLFQLKYSARQITHVDPRKELGTFKDKQRQQSSDILVKMEEIQKQISLYAKFNAHFEFQKWNITEICGTTCQLEPKFGLRYSNILSSRFCFGKLLKFRDELRKAVEPHKESIRIQMEVITKSQCASCHPHNGQNWFRQSRRLPDIEQTPEWEYSLLCCRERKTDMLQFSDITFTFNCFEQILLKINQLKPGNSLFLCYFPLLTRLQLGFIYLLTQFFGMVLLCSGGEKSLYPQGVLLHRFLGVNNEEECAKLLALTKIVKGMENTDRNNSILEIVPISLLVELASFNEILRYNLSNTARELHELINITRATLATEKQTSKVSA